MAVSNPINTNIQQEKTKTDNGIKVSHEWNNGTGKTWGTINTAHWKNLNNPSTHKSLDFSNVNIYGENNLGNYNAGDEYDMRRFHQMVIYAGRDDNCTNIITSNLPERVQYSLNSSWKEPLNFNNALTNLLFQAQATIRTKEGKKGFENIPSGVNRAATMRIWEGTQPLSMQVTIPVLDDYLGNSGTNLVEALEVLGNLALPSYGKGADGWYTPPPNPITATIKFEKGWATKDDKDKGQIEEVKLGGATRIMIQLGGILLIDHCVIESISVDYPDTKTMIQHDYSKGNLRKQVGDSSSGYRFLHPLLANVTIKFSTVEAMTKERYNAMLWAKPQTANFELDLVRGLAGKVEGSSDNTNNNSQSNTNNQSNSNE